MQAQALVTNAIYKSLQDRQQQPNINAGYEQFALTQLNYVLDEWRDLIPFQELQTFNNVTELTNTTFLSVSQVNYVLNNVQMPLRQVDLTRFVEIQNVLNLMGIPEIWYWNELTQTIMVYPGPSNPSYQFTVWGRVAQQPLGLFDQLPANMPSFMINAVTYEVAFRLAAEYGVDWNDKKESQRQSLLRNLRNKKSIDLSPQREIVFGYPGSAQIPPFPFFYYLSGGGAG